jgi:hypothetical protein
MQSTDVLGEAFGRIRQLVERSVAELDSEELAYRPEADANSIGWLIWHLTRIQDDHVAELAGREQLWIAESWADRFDMPADRHNTGYGHTTEQVAALRLERPDLLIGYHRAVTDRTLAYLADVDSVELDRIIDRSYDPPVSVGVRLVSVISDNLQHAGQALYVRGILERSRPGST